MNVEIFKLFLNVTISFSIRICFNLSGKSLSQLFDAFLYITLEMGKAGNNLLIQRFCLVPVTNKKKELNL